MKPIPSRQDRSPTRSSRARFTTLVRRAIDLRRLYLHAANASEPGLRVVLNENARTLDLVVLDLQAQLHTLGLKRSVHGSWRASTHRHLSTWLMHATPKNGVGWLRLLGHHESALLHAFEQTLANVPSEYGLPLRRQMPRLYGIHLDMDSLAGTTHH